MPLEGSGRSERSKHDGTCGDVLDVGQVELERAIDQVAFQRFDVTAIQAPCNDQRRSGTRNRANQDGRVLARGRKQQKQPYQASTNGIAQAVFAARFSADGTGV
jgi:hypothetical protein